MSNVQPVPEGFNTVSAYLIVPSCQEALDFYGKAFAAETIIAMKGPGGHGVIHAEMRIGNSAIMLTDENPQWQKSSPKTLGGTPVSMFLYVEDCDAVFNQAVEAGCEVKVPLDNMFWGDRFGALIDPYGHEWQVATHIEDVAPDEMERRAEAWFASMAQQAEGH